MEIPAAYMYGNFRIKIRIIINFCLHELITESRQNAMYAYQSLCIQLFCLYYENTNIVIHCFNLYVSKQEHGTKLF